MYNLICITLIFESCIIKIKIKIILDLLHPCQTDAAKWKEQQKLSYDSHTQPRQFGVGDAVWARNFHQGPRWSRATVSECSWQCNVQSSVRRATSFDLAKTCKPASHY